MHNIFDNQEEVVENIKESAKSLGIKGDVAPEKKKVAVVKKNCKLCWGRGVLTYSPPPKKFGRGQEAPEKNAIYCKCVKVIEI